uniref:Taste receptor type 2 n=1 Tax=Pyxicephalus adspersus TaxID=30357 RepID=A0AAV3AFZ5_PYXAD|nr:TPA: hypothetical protein GDO54_009877 [Pyxicephalus adspersus]
MANATEGEYYNHIMLFWLPVAASAVVSLAGLLLQIFIVAVNVIDWLKERSMLPADQIITSLSISRIVFHIVCLMEFLNHFPVLSVIPEELAIFLWRLSEFSSIWLSTLLSVFFFLKISTFHNVYFLRLKTLISQKIVYLITVCVVFSLVYAFSFFLFPINLTKNYVLHFLNKFPTEAQIMANIDHVWNTISLIVSLASSVLLIISLRSHIRKMSNHGNIMSSGHAFIRTIKFTAVSFLAYTFYVLFGMAYKIYFKNEEKWFILTWISLSVLHSVLLVYATTKIRNKFLTIVHGGKRCLFNRHFSE